MNRRTLLSGASALVATATLAACATGAPVTPASVSQDVVLIASSFAVALPQVTGVPAATTAAINAAIADLVSVASAIGTADTISAAKPLIVRVETDVNGAITALAPFAALLPAPVSTVLQAATVLLPVLEAAVGLLVPATASPGSMTPDKARKVLRRFGQ